MQISASICYDLKRLPEPQRLALEKEALGRGVSLGVVIREALLEKSRQILRSGTEPGSASSRPSGDPSPNHHGALSSPSSPTLGPAFRTHPKH